MREIVEKKIEKIKSLDSQQSKGVILWKGILNVKLQ